LKWFEACLVEREIWVQAPVPIFVHRDHFEKWSYNLLLCLCSYPSCEDNITLTEKRGRDALIGKSITSNEFVLNVGYYSDQ
jgi:hypothetical protein